MRKPFIKYFLNIILIIFIGIIVYFTALRGNSEAIFKVLKDVSLTKLLLCFGMVLIWQIMVATVLTYFTRLTHPKYRLYQGLINSLVASFFHGITPSSSGGQFAQIYVFRKQGVDSADAASVLWMEFIVYQSTMCIYGLLLIILRFHKFYSQFSAYFVFVLLGFLINTAIIFFLYALGKSKKLHTYLSTKGVDFLSKLHLIKNPEETRNKLEKQVVRFGQEVDNLKNRKKMVWVSSFLCIIRLTAYYAIPFVIFMALGEKGDFNLFIDCLAMGSFVAIASGMVPIPGASGGAEAIFVLMFSNLFPDIIVRSAMLLWRFFTYYLLLLLGGIAFIAIKIKD